MKKSELNKNIHLSEGNIKSKETDDVLFLTWSLPSRKTCPYSTEMCRKRCFAKKNENFSGVRLSRERNLEETKKDSFTQDMINHLEYHLSRPKVKGKNVFVRIHTSGDFFSVDYLKKWVSVANYFKGNDNILFQAYTKSMPILEEYLNSDNSKKDISDINIKFVWSIWNDTPNEYTSSALKLNMQTFKALPKDEVLVEESNGSFVCKGDCGLCKECYTGTSHKIVIPYH